LAVRQLCSHYWLHTYVWMERAGGPWADVHRSAGLGNVAVKMPFLPCPIWSPAVDCRAEISIFYSEVPIIKIYIYILLSNRYCCAGCASLLPVHHPLYILNVLFCFTLPISPLTSAVSCFT
jgi:hypothetical protein